MHKTNPSTEKAVHVVSLGCPKNLVDSEVMLGSLAKANYHVADHAQDAGVIIVNTCGFIDASKKESIEAILEMSHLKTRGACHTLVVTGCLVQRYAQELLREIPEVDLFIGTNEYYKIAEHLTAQRIAGTSAPMHLTLPTYIHSENTPRAIATGNISAYLKIAEGCKKRCSFCIIPTMRGDLRSRSIDSLFVEARSLVQRGYSELNLVAQDLTDYGLDLRDRKALPKLLEKLSLIDGNFWLRLFYAYPDGISDELMELLADNEKVCRYLDMPLQHANDTVLRRMNRAITREKMTRLIEKLRQRIPEISIRTSFIVGFPGETEEQFQELCDFVQWARLDHVGVFTYSREEGTPSYALDGQLPQEIKEERHGILKGILDNIALDKARDQVGKTFKVLVEGKSDDQPGLFVGRNDRQARDIDTQIYIRSRKDIATGNFVNVEITEAVGPDLAGVADAAPIAAQPSGQQARAAIDLSRP
jgi:ribosomal protein S12 methylthiotransferase